MTYTHPPKICGKPMIGMFDWHLYDLIGNADEWTTTPNADYPGEFLAVGGSVTVNGTGTQDLRLDEKHAGVRLVRGTSVVTFTPPSP